MGVRLLRGDNVIGGFQLGATFIVLGLWVLGGAVEMMATSFVVFSVGRTAHFVGTALVPVTLLICFRELHRQDNVHKHSNYAAYHPRTFNYCSRNKFLA